MQLHTALETHGAVAEWEGDRLTVWESTQGIFRVRENVSKALGVPLSKVRVIKDYMGGGFGAKNGAGPHTYVAALFARRQGRAVRCINDREAEQTDSGNRPSSVAARDHRREIGRHADGDPREHRRPARHQRLGRRPRPDLSRMYACPNVRTEETFAYVNASGMAAFRGPGYVEGAFGLEGAMNALAQEH